MKTILYIRQSKDSSNAEESLAGQEFECREAANVTPGMQISQVLRDTVTGQLTIAEREDGRKLITAIRERECDAILMPSVDRLSRDTWGEQDLQLLIDLLKGSGIHWYFADNHLLDGSLVPFDFEDDTQIIAVKAQLGASALERINIAKRTMRKKRAMSEKGELVLQGTPPFGYEREWIGQGKSAVQTWVIEPAQEIIVKQIFDLHNSGLQCKQIAKQLNDANTITPGDAPWNTTALYRILSHEIYKGIFVWGKHAYNKKNGTKILREIGDPNRFDIPREDFRIVSDAIWERAQKLSLENKVVRTPREFLLRGHLVCECDEHFIGNGNYYRCKSSKNGNSCGIGSIRKDTIEGQIWGAVEDLILTPQAMHDAIWDTLEAGSSAQIAVQAQAKDMSKAIDAKNRQMSSTALAISRTEGERTILALTKQMDILEQELIALEQELTTLKAGLQTEDIDRDALNEDVHHLVMELLDDIENADYHKKREILAGLNLRVMMYADSTWKIYVSISGVS